jgi:hypothetical protein
MAINGIQFQKGLSPSGYISCYGSEEQCKADFTRSTSSTARAGLWLRDVVARHSV